MAERLGVGGGHLHVPCPSVSKLGQLCVGDKGRDSGASILRVPSLLFASHVTSDKPLPSPTFTFLVCRMAEMVLACAREHLSLSVVSDSATSWTVARLLCPWAAPGKNTGKGSQCLAHSKCSLNTSLNNQHCHHPHYYPHPEGRSGPACAKQSLAPHCQQENIHHLLMDWWALPALAPADLSHLLFPSLSTLSHLGCLLSLKHPALLSATGPLHILFLLPKMYFLTPAHSHPSHSKRPKSSVSGQTFFPQRCLPGTSLVVQWIRICLPRQRTRVRSRVWEVSTGSGAVKPGALQLLKPACPEACALQREAPAMRSSRTKTNSSLCSLQLETGLSDKDPLQPKINK